MNFRYKIFWLTQAILLGILPLGAFGFGALKIQFGLPAAPPAGPTYLISEDFEGVGTASGWTNAGTVNWNYVTSPAPLFGAESWFGGAAAGSTSPAFAPQSNVWAFFTFVRTADPSTGTRYICAFQDGAGAPLLSLRIGSSTMQHGSVSGAGGFTFTLNTQYFIWLHYIQGTGTNGIAEVYISTTTTRPGSPTGTFSTGTATAPAEKFQIGSTTSGSGSKIIDTVRVSTSEIFSNPP